MLLLNTLMWEIFINKNMCVYYMFISSVEKVTYGKRISLSKGNKRK